MKNLSDIKNRMKVVADTRKITGAMDTVSVVKMSRAIERCEQNSAYFEALKDAVADIVIGTSSWVHPCFKESKGGRAAFLVVASDKGLAGSFNHNVCEFAVEAFKDRTNPIVIAIGEMAREFFVKKGVSVVSKFCDKMSNPSIEDTAQISEFLIEGFYAGNFDEAHIIYTESGPGAGMKPVMLKLLPLTHEGVGVNTKLSSSKENYLHELYYEPSADEVLNRLIPQYLAGMIYGCLLKSQAAEHASRRAAMSEASRNADELSAKLKLEYNRARQSIVTGEINDIITASLGIKNENRR